MLSEEEFVGQIRIDRTRLTVWLAEGWIVPTVVEQRRTFREADVARALLIQDLSELFGVNDEGIDIVLALIDQLHSTRRDLDDIITRLGKDAPPE